MRSVIIAAVAALFVFALPVHAAEKPAAQGQKMAAAGDMTPDCKKAMDDCKAANKSEDECKKDPAVMKACGQ